MLALGDTLSQTVRVEAADVVAFATLTGDMAPHHLSDEHMVETRYGTRIAHGLHVLGLTGGLTSAALERTGRRGVTYGYDRIRFTRAVHPGAALRLDYEVVAVDTEKDRISGQITAFDDQGQVCLVATHLLQLQ